MADNMSSDNFVVLNVCLLLELIAAFYRNYLTTIKRREILLNFGFTFSFLFLLSFFFLCKTCDEKRS